MLAKVKVQIYGTVIDITWSVRTKKAILFYMAVIVLFRLNTHTDCNYIMHMAPPPPDITLQLQQADCERYGSQSQIL
jgi:hypothetical protein